LCPPALLLVFVAVAIGRCSDVLVRHLCQPTTVLKQWRVRSEGNWFFNNWGPPHPNVQVFSAWVEIVNAALKQNGASTEQKELFFGGASARAYGVKV
jgi:hypothetical protein